MMKDGGGHHPSSLMMIMMTMMMLKVKVKVWFYIALYPVRWTAQSALHFPPLADVDVDDDDDDDDDDYVDDDDDENGQE